MHVSCGWYHEKDCCTWQHVSHLWRAMRVIHVSQLAEESESLMPVTDIWNVYCRTALPQTTILTVCHTTVPTEIAIARRRSREVCHTVEVIEHCVKTSNNQEGVTKPCYHWAEIKIRKLFHCTCMAVSNYLLQRVLSMQCSFTSTRIHIRNSSTCITLTLTSTARVL